MRCIYKKTATSRLWHDFITTVALAACENRKTSCFTVWSNDYIGFFDSICNYFLCLLKDTVCYYLRTEYNMWMVSSQSNRKTVKKRYVMPYNFSRFLLVAFFPRAVRLMLCVVLSMLNLDLAVDLKIFSRLSKCSLVAGLYIWLTNGATLVAADLLGSTSFTAVSCISLTCCCSSTSFTPRISARSRHLVLLR